MDLSRLKWPILIVVLIGVGWLISDPGISFLHTRYTSVEPGVDAAKDVKNEAGLTKLGGFLMSTMRLTRASTCFEDARRLYPDGKNYWWNTYRLAECQERLGNPRKAITLYEELIRYTAREEDNRILENDALQLRVDKLLELHELGEIGM
ncbi:MAG: tetratricopeptide repeat protein [Candidatus Hydrogenedentes bacterium]|nr:tetratricopeptide repeat protein [Candidatus Hydrogenedentota bacterium]